MSSEEIWQYCDKKFFIPWAEKRLKNYKGEKSLEIEKLTNKITDLEKIVSELTKNIENLSIIKQSPQLGVNVGTIFTEIRDQLLSRGEIIPITRQDRPIYLEQQTQPVQVTETKWVPKLPPK